ncbi:MAG TPA: endonuclease/exonuclease/phosphatase family protein [Chitinophagaceae bacterium]|nr:endonuclease/exonuclease/phosphatase family protein [Chitinophagaceae bacterium]
MKKFFLLAVMTGFMLHVPAQKIRVLTYNIHHAQNMHGNIELDTLAAFILAQNADVVALQEVDSMCQRSGPFDIMKELGRRTGMYYYFGKAMNYDGGGYGEGLLTRWPAESMETVALPYQKDKDREPRAAISCVLKAPGGKRVRIIATHFDHLRDSADRIMQASHLYDLYKDETLPYIIMGDLNATPSELSIKRLLEITRLPRQDKQQPTFPSGIPKSKIDYILLSRRHNWKDLGYKVINEKYISDHCAVFAELRLP